jgi:CO/xanthine dehydrogenase Mo-binding subunit
MTEVLNKEFSRRTFVRGGGALIVGFSVLGAALAGKAQPADSPFASNGPYNDFEIDSWLAINADNTATLKTGIIELGQGTLTGLLMIAAEELDLTMAQMRYAQHDTNVTPNQGGTSGSVGTKTGGRQVRAAAAAARNALLDLAVVNLGVAKTSLTVDKGVVTGGGRSVTYGALLGDKFFNVRMPASSNMDRLLPIAIPNNLGVPTGGLPAGAPTTKPVSQYKLVGTRVPRVDIPDKVTGNFTYVHNIRVPGMIHGRVVRPRGAGSYGEGSAAKIVSVDERSIRHIPGARIVRYGDFLGVVAEHEYDAIQAAAQLKVTWSQPATMSDVGNLWKGMRDLDAAGLAPASVLSPLETVNILPITSGDVDRALGSAAIKLSSTYKWAYNGGMLLGPACALAVVTPNGARIFSNTQHAYGARSNVHGVLTRVMGTQAPSLNRIRVTYYEGSSPYGVKATTEDAAMSAAIMSALTGKPVRLQHMRWDEHGWNVVARAYMFDIRAGIDSRGNIVAIEHTDFLIPYHSTQTVQQQVTGMTVFSTSQFTAATTISGMQYGVANRKAIAKTLPQDRYLRTSVMRGPYRIQAGFAAEQMFDELAHAARMDPYLFRLQNVATTATDPEQRWRNVLTNAAALANWQPRVAASNVTKATTASGRGIAFGYDHGTVAAGVADIEVNKKTGKITVKNVYCCVDPGVVINPAGAENNLEGDLVQGISRVLREQVTFNKRHITSLDWVTYPILRFSDSPKVAVKMLSRTDIVDRATGSGSHSGGGGEAAASVVGAAVANAFFDATGVRLREAPMTPARVLATLEAAGVG